MMDHPLSCVWSDFVSNTVVTGRTNNLHIKRFLEGMDSLGEAFIFGSDNPSEWLEDVGFGVTETQSSAEYLNESDPVLMEYSFSVAKR
jgi:hypothetical protein